MHLVAEEITASLHPSARVILSEYVLDDGQRAVLSALLHKYPGWASATAIARLLEIPKPVVFAVLKFLHGQGVVTAEARNWEGRAWRAWRIAAGDLPELRRRLAEADLRPAQNPFTAISQDFEIATPTTPPTPIRSQRFTMPKKSKPETKQGLIVTNPAATRLPRKRGQSAERPKAPEPVRPVQIPKHEQLKPSSRVQITNPRKPR